MTFNKLVALDIEVLPNYFLLVVKGLDSGKYLKMDMYGEDVTLTKEQRSKINNLLTKYTSFGFNSLKYDIPLINYALSGANCKELHRVSKLIIEKNQPDWMTYRNLGIDPRPYDHFDISEPSPAVMISLKNYGTRVGSKKLQEFYLDPHTPITKEQVEGLIKYCENDVEVTHDLYEAIKDRIELRVEMGKQYGLDLRSKSDAQIAETVLSSELKKVGVEAKKPTLSEGFKATYVAPDYINFNSKQLKEIVELVENVKFDIADNGAVKMPKSLSNYKIVIGNTTYKMGIGGLHSQEKSISVESNDKNVMRNADFSSYYPFIILNQKLYPKHLGKKFLDVYRKIVETRLKAKAEGNKLVADSLKITINGSFGKFGSKYSKLYSPNMLLATTITGQLTLLMLIEQLEENGIPVISANTDGLEYYCPRDKVDLAETIIFDLELATGYEMEHGEYKALYAKDVNNYVAIYDGYVKAKGLYAETTLSKGRSTPIVYTAIREYLLTGKSIQETITSCNDINEFVSARTVKGGGVYKGEYLGKMVRWYYSTEGDIITYSTNGNLVPKTGEGNGVKPMMDLTDELPDDLDYKWYIDEAISKLKDLGVEYGL
jgi:hypothetical protein